MTEYTMEINHRAVEFSHNRPKTLDESVLRYVEQTWPHHPGHHLQRAFGLTADQAREVLRGRTSKTIFVKMASHPVHGWDFTHRVLGPLNRTPHEIYAERERARRLDAFEAAGALDCGPRVPALRRLA